jgi:mono/diheme cytochrome c family protein
MSSKRLVLLLVLAGASASCIDENILDPMADRQPRAGRYKESAFFANGLSMHAPPEGTVPRERITQNAPLTTGRLPDGPIQANGEPLPRYVNTIPVPVTPTLLALGRKRFDITCGTCHGPVGDGISIVGSQMALRPPPSLVTKQYIEKPAGYIYEVVTKGFGLMASYAGELTIEERWGVVAYLRALQLSQTATVADVPPAHRAELDAPTPAAPSHAPPGKTDEEHHQ